MTKDITQDIQVAGIIGFNSDEAISAWQETLYLHKKEVCIKLVELQIQEYERLKDSIDDEGFEDEGFEDDAYEERVDARNALDDFFFYSQMGLKLTSGEKPRYHIPKKYRIITFTLLKETIEQISKGDGFSDIYQQDKVTKKELKK